MTAYVNEYVKGCDKCQQTKINHRPWKGPLMPIKGPLEPLPFKQASMDLMTDLPPTEDGYDTLLVVVDHGLSKGIILIPTVKTVTSTGIAELLQDNVTAYHPQLDGATERVMQEIQAYLSIYCLSNPREWIESIPLLEFVHNSRPHADRKQSPFEIIMGYQPQGIPQSFSPSKVPSLEE
jgi:hypothetical protein